MEGDVIIGRTATGGDGSLPAGIHPRIETRLERPGARRRSLSERIQGRIGRDQRAPQKRTEQRVNADASLATAESKSPTQASKNIVWVSSPRRSRARWSNSAIGRTARRITRVNPAVRPTVMRTSPDAERTVATRN
jgi:hypothetical protein